MKSLHASFPWAAALLLLLLSLCAAAQPDDDDATAAPPGEFRGVWIHLPTGVGDWGWDKSIRVLSEQGFNAIFVNLVWAGCADYPSKVLTPHPSLKQKDGSCRDLLRECLDACHTYGVQLHVWIVTCNATYHAPEAVRERFRQEGRLQSSVNPKADKCYIAPQLEANLRMLDDTVTEILETYDVDGIHLDYIRYPDDTYDYSEEARKDFMKSTGLPEVKWPEECQRKGGRFWPQFNQWRRENVTGMVRRVRQAIDRSSRPSTALSVAVYGLWQNARETVAQDAAAWIDEGLVDFLCPMNYSANPVDAAYWLRLQVAATRGRVPLYHGLGVYMCPDAAAVAQQIDDGRRYGADGFILFQYRPPLSDKWLPQLHRSAVQGHSSPPYAHQLKGFSCEWSRFRAGEALPRIGSMMPGDVLEAAIELPEGISAKDVRCTILLNGEPYGEPELTECSSLRSMRLLFSPKEAGFYRLCLRWTQPDGTECRWLSVPCRIFQPLDEMAAHWFRLLRLCAGFPIL